MVDHVNPEIAHHKVFHTWGSLHQPKICSFCPPRKITLTKFLFPLPSTKQQFSSYNPIKTAFLAGLIVPPQFYFNYILFGHTGMLILILIDVQYSQKAVALKKV